MATKRAKRTCEWNVGEKDYKQCGKPAVAEAVEGAPHHYTVGLCVAHEAEQREHHDNVVPLKAAKRPSLEQVIRLSRAALDEGNKINAIRIVRENTDFNLLEAKMLVEMYDDGTSCRTLAAQWKRENGTITNGEILATAKVQEQPVGEERRMSFSEFMTGLKAAGFVNAEQWIREHGGAR
jgi:ribosomal protein L7/L12